MKHGTKRRGLEPALERGDAEQSAGYVLQHLDGFMPLNPKATTPSTASKVPADNPPKTIVSNALGFRVALLVFRSVILVLLTISLTNSLNRDCVAHECCSRA